MKKKFLSLLTAVSLAASLFVSPALAKDVEDYQDVPENSWFYEYVADVSQKELMTGLNKNTFGPAVDLGRGQFTTVIYRMSDSPATSYKAIFSDVLDGRFYSIPVTWANGAGIVTGYSNGKFGPADVLTREQMVTILYRYANVNEMDTSAIVDYSDFPDAGQVSSFASQAMGWAIGSGIISGDQGKINPQGTVSRAVCATMIARFTGFTPIVTEPVPDDEEEVTVGKQNALAKAKEYLSTLPFSYNGLIAQLENDGFSNEEATYAAENCGADWKEQALKSAKSYLEDMPFSYSGLIDQLEHDGFSTEEATYAADNCGADWKEQALKSAKSYLENMPFSYSGLIDQLKHGGFTQEEATYAADNCGANWEEQAARAAKSYLKNPLFTRQELIDQLKHDGFTQEEAEYGVSAVES